MKNFILLLILSPLFSFGQNKKDDATVMEKFVKYYNGNKTDIICSLFQTDKNETCFWAKISDTRNTYGKIINYKYLGVDPIEKVTVYKVRFENKGIKAISFILNNNKFETFRFDTSSEYIEGLLAKDKSKYTTGF